MDFQEGVEKNRGKEPGTLGEGNCSRGSMKDVGAESGADRRHEESSEKPVGGWGIFNYCVLKEIKKTKE